MSSEHMREIQIDGVKLEVDMRTARKVDCFRVGNKVKLLKKGYSSYSSYPAIIVGIDAFKKLPTVVLAYIDNPLSDNCGLKFEYLNAKSSDVEICPMVDDDIMPTMVTMREHFDRAISAKHRDIQELTAKKEYFLRKYGEVIGVEPSEVLAGKDKDNGDS